jgi:predicted outer membrane protein
MSTSTRCKADDGTDPQLKELARTWLPTIQAHLELAVFLARHVGGSSPLR